MNADDKEVAQNGNVLRHFSSYTTVDGAQHEMVDAWLQTLADEKGPELSSAALAEWVAQASVLQTVSLSGNQVADVRDLRLSDLMNVPQQMMLVKADAADVVRLEQTGWVNTGTTAMVDQHTYVLWSQAGAHLLIDQQAQVQAVL